MFTRENQINALLRVWLTWLGLGAVPLTWLGCAPKQHGDRADTMTASPGAESGPVTEEAPKAVRELVGLDGKLCLRDDIQRRINAVLAPHKIERVYTTEFKLEV